VLVTSPLHDLDFGSAAQALAALDALGVPELEVLHRLELTAGDLYVRMADGVEDTAVAEVLRRNAREELGHAKRVRRALNLKAGEGYVAPDLVDELYPIDAPSRVEVPMLHAMVTGERSGDADYQRWADAETDAEVARLLRISGAEETRHAERLEAALGRD
jgi:rubrerythrin